jgi:ABC-type lipoprotein release transport system permease subunit
MFPAAIGLAVGFAGTLVLGRFLKALLFQVPPYDPLALALAVVAVLIGAPLASYGPVRRATAVDCNVALRDE